MSFQYQGFEAVTGIEPERALNIGVGVAQAPLWAAFYASAGLGAAWWWSTAWTRPAPSLDFEKLFAPAAPSATETYLEALDEAVCELIETAQEEVVEAKDVAEAVEESVELAQDVAVEGLRDAQDDIQAAVAGALQPDAAVEPLAFAASEDVVADPVTIQPESGLPLDKPAKKKGKAEA